MAEEARLGDFRVICDRSGFKVWASQTVIEPVTGLRVLRRFADPINPLDTPPVIRGERPVPNPRPEGADAYLSAPVLPSDL